MNKKGWRIINAVEAAINGHPDHPDHLDPSNVLTPDDIENARQAQLLSEYHRDKMEQVRKTAHFGANFGEVFSQVLKKS